MKKHVRYLKYVLKHKLYVLRAAISLGIVWRGLLHDLSKFRPDEWRPYANWYFGQTPQSDLSRGLPSQDVTLALPDWRPRCISTGTNIIINTGCYSRLTG